MERKQEKSIASDLEKKIVFITGPRQAGKTTLSKNIASRMPGAQYLNSDYAEDRRVIIAKTWNRRAPLIVFDEIHKWRSWKNHLKGVFDVEGIRPRLLVTGSARLDLVRRGGDSLAGRYLLHRLYPFSAAELKDTMPPHESIPALMALGGFPEPFLSGSKKTADRWRINYLDRIIREDVRDLTGLRDSTSVRILIDMLRERVGSPVSYRSLAEDLAVSPVTVKSWIDVLEAMFIVFRVAPYHTNIARALKKESKIYFYDIGMVRGDAGVRFENLVALSLLKHLHFRADTIGEENALCYVRDKEKREVDFAVVKDGAVGMLIESKLSDHSLHPPLRYYHERFPKTDAVQLVHSLTRTQTISGIQLEPAAWLAGLSL